MKEIPLTQGQVALVDDEDFNRVSVFKWLASRNRRTFYARRFFREPGGSCKSISLHRFILAPLPGFQVDHISGNGLDCRRANLRLVDQSENGVNRRPELGCSSRYKGVSWDSEKQRWRPVIKVHGKRIRLGSFKSELEAARAYDEAAKNAFGEFARLNLSA